VRIFDEGSDDSYVFYTMPYLEGLTLRKIIDLRTEKRQAFSLTETLPLLVQLAAGIDSLSRFGGHGALRPSNILVLPDVLKVTGAAHLRGLPRRPFIATHHHSRSLEYIAPEARRDDSVFDTRADVFSLAVITTEMLTGHVYGRDPSVWPEAQQALPRGVVAELTLAMSAEPKTRLKTAQDFFQALVDAAEHSGADLGNIPRLTAPAPAMELLQESTEPEQAIEEVPASKAAPRKRPKSGPPPPPPPPIDPLESHDTVMEPPPAAIAGPPPPAPVPATHLETPVVLLAKQPTVRLARGKVDGDEAQSDWRWSLFLVLLTLVMAGLTVAGALYYAGRKSDVLRLAPAPNEPDALKAIAPDLEPPPDPSTAHVKGKVKGKTAARHAESSAMLEGRNTPGAEDKPPEPKVILVEPPSREPVKPNSGSADAPPPPEPPPPPLRVIMAEPKPKPQTDAEPEQEVTAVAVPSRKTCPDGMVKVDGAEFQLGTHPNDPLRSFGDLTVRAKTVGPYCIDIYEYPNQRGKRPMTNVTWAKAKATCEQVGKRLCTEAEWEYACKGPKNARFPMGSRFDATACNTGGEGRQVGASGAFGRCRSAFGVADLGGNVAEWTSGRWSNDIADKVVKGGSADQAYYTARCSARTNEGLGAKLDSLGFRCCATLE
jgi:formylglycine-generating enzyme required for sulfatase activity